MALKSYGAPRPNYWVTVGGKTKKGEVNPESVEGYYLGRTEGENKFRPGETKVTFMIQTEKGIAGINGNAGLVTKMTDAELGFKAAEKRAPLGTYISINCTGETTTRSGNNMKTYEVQFDSDNNIDVSVLPVGDGNEALDDDDGNYAGDDDFEQDLQDKQLQSAASLAGAQERKTKLADLVNKRRAL